MAEATHLLGLPRKHKPKDIQPQGEGSGLDADKVDGLHASEIGGGGPHASSHETGGGDLVHFADLEHDEGDSTLHDAFTSVPHISQAEKDKIHGRLHALDSALDHSGVISDGQHGEKTSIPSAHHDEYNWAHQCHHRTFFLPFVYTNDFNKLGAVLEPSPGQWDSGRVQHPSVVKHGNYYYLFYCGDQNTDASGKIGVARATDPEGSYTKLGAILDVADPDGFMCPSVIYDDYETDANKKWKMWMFKTRSGESVREIMYSYSANPDSGWSTPVTVFQITDDPWFGHAVLKAGNLYLFFVPKKADKNLYLYVSKDPDSKGDDQGICISKGASGAWDGAQIRYVGVVYISGVLYVLYSGMDNGYLKIGMALCTGDLTDETNYKKYALNPVIPIGQAGDPDVIHAFSPCLLQVGEKFYCWYTGVKNTTPGERDICLARIP